MGLPKELAPSWTFSCGFSLPFQSESCAGASGSIRNQASLGRAADTQGSEVASHLLGRNNLTDHRQDRIGLPAATASSQKSAIVLRRTRNNRYLKITFGRLFTIPARKEGFKKLMATEFDWKKFQFITTVQTALINNAINLSLEDDAKEKRHWFSAIGTLGLMADAFRAAEKLPETLSAAEAADQWLPFILRVEGAEPHDWFMVRPESRSRRVRGNRRP